MWGFDTRKTEGSGKQWTKMVALHLGNCEGDCPCRAWAVSVGSHWELHRGVRTLVFCVCSHSTALVSGKQPLDLGFTEANLSLPHW